MSFGCCIGWFECDCCHLVNRRNTRAITASLPHLCDEGHPMYIHFPTEDGGAAALLHQSGARRQQRGRGLSAPVLPPAALAENRAGQGCEHYFTALFITARLRPVTTSSPFKWNTSCRSGREKWDGFIVQEMSRTYVQVITYLIQTEHSFVICQNNE